MIEFETSIDIYQIINGKYIRESVFESIDIENVNEDTEIQEFCNRNNCECCDYDDSLLVCKDTKQPKFYVR